MANPLVEDTSQHMLALLPLLNRLVATEVRREVGEAVSVLQLRVLITLLDEAQTLSSLAREYHVSPQALCDVAHNLVERGWLARTPLPHDRRQHLLAVTDVGRVAYSSARERCHGRLRSSLAISANRSWRPQVALPALHRVVGASGAERLTGGVTMCWTVAGHDLDEAVRLIDRRSYGLRFGGALLCTWHSCKRRLSWLLWALVFKRWRTAVCMMSRSTSGS